MIIDVKEQICLPNEIIVAITQISTVYRFFPQVIGINKEKEICLPNEEQISFH